MITYLKKIPQALYNLFFFQSVTTIPRWMEICYGFMAWILLLIIVYSIFESLL
jgi:hypothetical protein